MQLNSSLIFFAFYISKKFSIIIKVINNTLTIFIGFFCLWLRINTLFIFALFFVRLLSFNKNNLLMNKILLLINILQIFII